MTQGKYGYGWALKWLLAALLLGVGIYMVVADQVVYVITGVAIVVFGLLRVVPLLKSLNKEILRTLNLIEVIFNVIIGAMLIYVAVKELHQQSFWAAFYRYALVAVFYGRALIYFNSVVFLGEKTEVPKFWGHIVIITVAAIIAVIEGFDAETVGLFFLIIALVGAIYLGYDGFGGYKKYREYAKELNEGKSKKKTKDKEKEEAPILDVPKEEDDRPYVN